MGMMSVLMQLRKVCNHPDLFEPRSIITPFFTSPLTIVAASCITRALEKTNLFQDVSPHLLHPLWSSGCGIPSFKESLKQDVYQTSQLAKLQINSDELLNIAAETSGDDPDSERTDNPQLFHFFKKIWDKSKNEKINSKKLQGKINSLRCQCISFLYPSTLQDAINVDISFSDDSNMDKIDYSKISSTPSQLLEMKKSQQERAVSLDRVIENFVFCVPKAAAKKPTLFSGNSDYYSDTIEKKLSAAISRPIQIMHEPFHKAHARLTSFFPDKKLVQFDAGKLQSLAQLLRKLKSGSHRVLIFTQMSKMLDILETFLNLNGHTYLRLDGATGVEKRQRLMDRFNSDERLFCFILSTRSGGLGINLTGADTVVFYDSDWNPAMDAQAQDRAHRIGQTRDVHIYRLVTEHTIEENILFKAKQKRQLDFLVMDEGKFNARESRKAQSSPSEENEESRKDSDVFTKGGLREILGVGEAENNITKIKQDEETDKEPSQEQVESAMVSLEDEDDVIAMRGAQKEAADELEEFNDNAQPKQTEEEVTESQDETENGVIKRGGKEKEVKVRKTGKKANTVKNNQKTDEDIRAEANEEEMEKEFAAWQSKVGVDKASIHASLIPTERYALQFREEIDPFYSMWFLSEQQRLQEAGALDEEWDVEAIEEIKAEEELRAIEDGDILATQPFPDDLSRQRQLYFREKSRLRGEKKRRKLTGENWGIMTDGKTQLPFWYNSDTGEAVWDKPKVLINLDAEERARRKKWNAIPIKPLTLTMSYLLPYPDRMRCALVCRQWRLAAQNVSFIRHVYPVEMGALTMDPKKMDNFHYRTIAEALSKCLPGDTIGTKAIHHYDFFVSQISQKHFKNLAMVIIGYMINS
jgi:E1A-binding protein p400